jgi:transcriptional regulator with XRE-family HTH domain
MVPAVSKTPTSERKLTVFSNNVERLRAEQRLTKVQLADLAGVGRATLQRIVGGENPSASTARKLADALGVAESDLWAQAAVTVPLIEPAIQGFIHSPWASVLRPPLTEGDLQQLRKLAGAVWVNVKPSDEVLYHLVLANRAQAVK